MQQLLSSALSFLHQHRGALALIFFLLVFHGITNYFVMQQDTVFFDKISALQYIDAAELSQEGFRALLFAPWHLFTRYDVATQYPFVSPAVSALFLSLFGFTQDIAVMSNLIWLAILLPSLYAIALKLFNRNTALFSVLLVSFFPGMVAATRGFMKDLPLTAMVALSLALLIYSDGMKKRLPSILFGFAIALTALTHSQFILFLSGPFLLVVVIPWIKSYRQWSLITTKGPLGNFLIAAAIVLLLAAPWYLIYAVPFLKDVAEAGVGRPLSFSLLVPLSALRHNLSLTTLLLAVCAFVLLRDTPKGHFLLGWTLPTVLFTATQMTRIQFIPRYILPAIPAFAIPLGWMLNVLLKRISGNGRRGSRAVLASCFFLFCLGMLLTHHTTFVEYRDLGGALEGRAINPFELSMGYRISPVRIEADIESAVAALMNSLETWSSPPELFITNHLGTVTQMVRTELEVRQALAGEQLFFLTECINLTRGVPPYPWEAYDVCIERIESADYLIIEDMNSQPLETARNETFPLIINYIQENFDDFQVVAELPNRDLTDLDSAWLHPGGLQEVVALSEEEIGQHYDYFNSVRIEEEYTIPDFIKGRVLILKATKQ